jgi:hypothetical protein
MIREFKLTNEKGQEFSLMDIEKYCLLTEPSGLGYSYSTEYEQLGNNFLTNLKKLEQGIITGIANFLYYDNFMDFGNFIESAKKLQFIYSIPYKNEKKVFYRDVNIKSLDKSEKQTNGVISETIEFECLSLWYEQNETIFKIETYEDEMRYNYRWNSRYIDYNTRAIQFNNKGHVDAPFQVEIDGFVQNPTISIFVEDEEYANIKIPITINEYEKLLYSSKVGEIYIQKQNTDGTKVSLWKNQYIDIKKQNIFKLPLGVSEIRLTADDDVLNAKLTIFTQYKVV